MNNVCNHAARYLKKLTIRSKLTEKCQYIKKFVIENSGLKRVS